MLGEVIGLAAQATSCDACLAYLIDRPAGELVLRASLLPHAADLGSLRMKIGEGVAGWVVENNSVAALAPSAAEASPFQTVPGAGRGYLPALSLGAAGERRRGHRGGKRPPSRAARAHCRGDRHGGLHRRAVGRRDFQIPARGTSGAPARRNPRDEAGVGDAQGGGKGQRYPPAKHGISEEESYLRLRNQAGGCGGP